MSKIREEQKVTLDKPFIDVDANHVGKTRMGELAIYKSVMSKMQQLKLTTQLLKIILKI